jgi:hypothetical protein
MFFGYDPGGNGKHGVAALFIEHGNPIALQSALVETAEAAVQWFAGRSGAPIAIGVDTLTCWSTGSSGWRPADRWLKGRYPKVQASIASPNSLYGAMSINGMAALLALREIFPKLLVTETHPKVLHWHILRRPYDYISGQAYMLEALTKELGIEVTSSSDHEWDAVLSALVAFRGVSGQWRRDLHKLPTTKTERLVMPFGVTNYFWPE